ncbi:MAG: ABC transporter substrate-binding protein [Candidatus Tectimicrobiota bacterium]|nr:MAG: ABC transporter substrate-binding protein [Candidatus Tectomicrobia bacterium]
MARRLHGNEAGLSRRQFLATTGSTLAGAAAFGLVRPAHASKRHPTRGGSLRFAMRSDSTGLDPHRNIIYLVSHPLAATTQGLLDLNLKSEPVPGIAYEWEASKDLQTYTFKLQKGVLFHNGREVDAAAVKWNYERIKDPKKSHAFTRSALGNLKEVEVIDKYTLRCHLHQPSAAFPANVVYYPCNLMAPDSEEQADIHPIGCGPFKFVKWERHNVTVLERFENYFETDAEGNSLPYLDEFIGRPKKQDRVRLTALRAGEVDLIDNMAYADAAEFPQRYAGQFQTWEVPALGTSFITFNLENGPFTDKRLRLAAAHAIDHEAIHQAVFYGRGDIAVSYYPRVSPWHAPNVRPWPEYDPDKAKFLIRQARAEGTTIVLQAQDAWPYMQQTAEIVQAMWTEVGFKVQFNIYDAAVLQQKRRAGDFHADSMAGSYRFDPDGWFSRQILSSSPLTQGQSRFHNEKVDKLILEARRTADKQKRLEIYGEIDSLINEELPVLYIHHLTLLEAGVMNLKGYQPAISGPYSTKGAGIRTAWLA